MADFQIIYNLVGYGVRIKVGVMGKVWARCCSLGKVMVAV